MFLLTNQKRHVSNPRSAVCSRRQGSGKPNTTKQPLLAATSLHTVFNLYVRTLVQSKTTRDRAVANQTPPNNHCLPQHPFIPCLTCMLELWSNQKRHVSNPSQQNTQTHQQTHHNPRHPHTHKPNTTKNHPQPQQPNPTNTPNPPIRNDTSVIPDQLSATTDRAVANQTPPNNHCLPQCAFIDVLPELLRLGVIQSKHSESRVTAECGSAPNLRLKLSLPPQSHFLSCTPAPTNSSLSSDLLPDHWASRISHASPGLRKPLGNGSSPSFGNGVDILVAYDDGVEYFNSSEHSFRSLVLPSAPVSAVDYHYQRKEAFAAWDNRIYR
ncbi:hypothetical protein J6590_066981 [Homalodisca vitripennis]|nr:hypothetical protein J6590_066981 [Homalodisca vitripennis]